MLIETNDGKRYVDLAIYLLDNPCNIELVKVKSSQKVYRVVGQEPLVTDYEVDYSKLAPWTVGEFIRLIRSDNTIKISIDTYQEYVQSFNNVEVSRELDDIKPEVSPE